MFLTTDKAKSGLTFVCIDGKSHLKTCSVKSYTDEDLFNNQIKIDKLSRTKSSYLFSEIKAYIGKDTLLSNFTIFVYS